MEGEEVAALNEAVAARVGFTFPCPHCAKDVHIANTAQFQEKTCLSLVMHLDDGHRIQAGTLGSQLVNLEKLLKATSKEMGAKIQVLVDGLSFAENDVTIKVMLVSVKPPVEDADSGKGPRTERPVE